MRTIPPKGKGAAHRIKRSVDETNRIARERILAVSPVKTKDDFTKEELRELEEHYRFRNRKIHALDTMVTFGPYRFMKIEDIVDSDPNWILRMIEINENFVIQDSVLGAIQKKQERQNGKE